ncbi:sugar ABC transporter permease [Streptomyces sioyaensis]|uniref:Sugar ABC transporter permease n=1 Tax=Streptomyces sioyaensis TaxID=67364 RepID=A0A4Q1R4M9_9ACTN|nr:sugar ABC transporter permease [Streptomyces sioyaensis]MBM4790767.1 sugar ABC transporter permease [Streptomyces sioyaensis]RXS67818.1 sugar ABC transporter permease [Streptomyces sioyaensis]
MAGSATLPVGAVATAPTAPTAWRCRWPLLPALLYMVVVTQAPFVFTVLYSFQSWNLVRPGSEHWVGLANYANVFTDNAFRSALLTEIEMTVLAVAFAMALGVPLAMLLDRRFPGRGVARTLLISPFLIMPTVSGLLWKTTMLDPVYGIVSYVLSWFGVPATDFVSRFPMASVVTVLVWQWTPFMMLIVLAGLQSQSGDVLEAARVDGAGPWTTFRWITLPHLRRYLELGVLLGAIYLVNTFDVIYMMTQGGPGTRTTNLPYYVYQRAFLGFDVGQASALGVVTVAGTIVVAAVALRLLFTVFSGTERSAG